MRDDELLLKLKKSPDEGIRLMIELYSGLVYTIVRSKLSQSVFSLVDIDSCVFDVFTEFYLDLKKFDLNCGSIRSWLCVIAKHNAYDYLRKHLGKKDVSLDALESIEIADEFMIETELEEREIKEYLIKVLDELGEPDREIILRKFYFGESSKSIGARLDISVSNVDTRTHRAIKKLRERFRGEYL